MSTPNITGVPKNETNKTDDHKEALEFLGRDFDNCFSQMARYQSLNWDICKFTFTAYAAILGIAVAVYKYSLVQNGLDLTPAAMAVLAASSSRRMSRLQD